jgi:cytochrome d ubiquinol oxidase subunit I
MDLDALLLSRLQFAFVIAFHILFPAFTIGLASYLAVLEGLWLKTGQARYQALYLFWVKIFALSFGMGVVSGVVMSYQFGTNWSEFSRITGGVIGPLMAYEVLTAFFLEATFLGIMLFGWKRVGPKLHFLATVLVALGTLTSAFWILSANSWMQSPVAFRIEDGRYVATDFWRVIFNPTFPSRFLHMVLAAYLTTALVVAATSAFQLLRRPEQRESRTGLKMAVAMIAMTAPLQIVVGHWSGGVMLEHQPAKLAAVEAYWETRDDQAFHIAAWPNRETERNDWELSIPGAGSWILGGKSTFEVKGLSAFPKEDRPPAAIVFWSFRLMVGLGMMMLLLGLWGGWLWLRRRLYEDRRFLRFAVAMGPAGFIAVLAGWVTTEVGRQPWVVYGVLRTRDAVSPVAASHVALSLLTYMAIYAIVFTAGALFILRLLDEGPAPGAVTEPQTPRAPGWSLAAAPDENPHPDETSEKSS